MIGYHDKGKPKICKIINAITKVNILGRDTPILLLINYVTLLEDEDKTKLLCILFQAMQHGVEFDLTPTSLGGKGGMRIEDKFFLFNFNEEKLYLNIERPTNQDLETLEWFKLSLPHPTMVETVRRTTKNTTRSCIPIQEWRKHLALVPEEVVTKTLKATTQF